MYYRAHAKKPMVPTYTIWVLFDQKPYPHPYTLWVPSRAEARESRRWSHTVYQGRHEYRPPVSFRLGIGDGCLWFLIDIDNSKFSGVKNYLWFFTSRRRAVAHRNKQNAVASNARVVGPFPFVPN